MSNESDRELLELAAKAAELNYVRSLEDGSIYLGGLLQIRWNPLDDDGDALRLAVKLGMYVDIDLQKGCVDALTNKGSDAPREWVNFEGVTQTIEQATRRAIVRAAAEIGRAKSS